jgi:hypothetical protein
MLAVKSRRFSRLQLATVISVMAATAVACGSSGPAITTSATSGPLSGICPNPLIIQTSWYPELEKSAVYALIGTHGKVDTTHGIYYGNVGGITVEVASGGPYQGNESDVAELYANPAIFMAEENTDDQVVNFAKHPTIAVIAPLQKSPLGMIWDPAVYHFTSIRQIGQSGAHILKAGEDASADLLTTEGVVHQGQWDFSYDGTPARFVASGGKLVVDDYVTEAPYDYQHFPSWGKKLDYLPLANAGYASYENSLVVTPQTLHSRAACLKKLVPMIQRAQVNFVKNPAPLGNALIHEATLLKSVSPLDTGLNNYTVHTLKAIGALANGTNGVYGSFNMTRVQQFISRLGPVAALEHVTLAPNIKASQIVTNQFLDPSVHLPS